VKVNTGGQPSVGVEEEGDQPLAELEAGEVDNMDEDEDESQMLMALENLMDGAPADEKPTDQSMEVFGSLIIHLVHPLTTFLR
jgi:hypothetical protein